MSILGDGLSIAGFALRSGAAVGSAVLQSDASRASRNGPLRVRFEPNVNFRGPVEDFYQLVIDRLRAHGPPTLTFDWFGEKPGSIDVKCEESSSENLLGLSIFSDGLAGWVLANRH